MTEKISAFRRRAANAMQGGIVVKKRIGSLLLVVAMCLTLLPTAAFAAEGEETAATPEKFAITSVDDLQTFANAVNEGKYNNQTDAVVSLEADLDLTDVNWVPIGAKFTSDGEIVNYFSGKFYGNGHTISNLDFSHNYGKSEYPSFGFFSEIYGAEISGLTIQGTVDVDSEKEYTFFGTLAGVAGGCKISDCVANLSFANNENRVYGALGLIGYSVDTTIEYCKNKGNYTITGDVGSLYVGGIAGFAGGTSEINYCVNTGDMTVNAPCAGGIVGHLTGNAKLINCYSVGKLTPCGKGIEDIGGIVGTVGSSSGTNNTVQHCYFGGEIDLSQYTATPPYTRFGGIVGQKTIATKDGVDVAVATFENNYFVATDNVTACSKYPNAGVAKTIDEMKTEAFLNEINNAGGHYQFNPNGTPVLPAPKYTVSFDITPADNLENVTVKIGEETLDLTSKKIALAVGTHTVTVEGTSFSKEITITADTATHTQTLNLSADYTKVDAALAKVPSDVTGYTDASVAALNDAVAAVVRTKNITEQTAVDAMAEAIEKAIAGLTRKSSGSSGSSGSSTPRYEVTAPGQTAGGTVSVSPKNASKGSTVTITVTPAEGYEVGSVTVKDAKGNTIAVTDKGNGKYTFTMPGSKVSIGTAFTKTPETSPFDDVSVDSYYFDAVKWAADKGITGGVSDNLFAPDDGCTRAHLVTFLWRTAGSPEPKSTAVFTDVTASAYYAKAVAWAVENGVTNGTTATTFDPDAVCTRAQAVTFLARALNGKGDSAAAFTDVPADSYYADAVAWAVANSVTNGVSSDRFAPDNSCTRAQITAFLYRAYVK